MPSILLVGTDTALIEGVSQTLSAAGHQLFFANSLADARDAAGDIRPMVVLVERSAIDEIRSTLRIPLIETGAMLIFQAEGSTAPPLPRRVQRGTLAQLELPLEKRRLLALVRYVENRGQIVGRDEFDREWLAQAN